MKNIRYILSILSLMTVLSCTDDFDDINTDKQGFSADEVSAKYFLTSSQFGLYAPTRFEYWRAHLIHTDRFAGHFTFGFNGSWWSDGLGYSFDSGYTDAAYGWLAGYYGNIKSFADLTTEGGEFENQYMFAMSQIMEGLYFQMYTDVFGMVPYTEAGVDGILTPKYDDQKTIYKGIIAKLDQAMATIGDATLTGTGVEDAGANDLYCGGDLQKWKKLANNLKLRIAMRALGAPGDDFASNAISEALAAPLLDAGSGSVLMKKDNLISEWSSSSYGDVWNDFGGLGSKWTVSKVLIDYLRDNNDPRLAIYAAPVVGGSFTFTDAGTDPNFQTRVDYIIDTLEEAGAEYSVSVAGDVTTVTVTAGQFIGQPVRFNGDMMPYVPYDMFSQPGSRIVEPRGTAVETYPEIIMSSAESYFLQAEAALRGIGSGDPQELLAAGIKEAMAMWGVSSGEADTYIASAPLADISTGTLDEKLEKVAVQRWLAAFTDGYEAWAIVRKTGYPAELAQGVSDQIIFQLGTLNGAYPQRLRYGSSAQANNNYFDAVSEQGADVQGTKLWFAK